MQRLSVRTIAGNRPDSFGEKLCRIIKGFGLHIPKGYVYFAMAFSVLTEMLNLRIRAPKTP